jgi:histidinol dehydrogenase
VNDQSQGSAAGEVEGGYSGVADAQLDELEAGGDPDLYNAVLDACELIFRWPAQAQARSTAVTTAEGVRLRLPVAGNAPYKVFWSSEGPRVEAVFPHPWTDEIDLQPGDLVFYYSPISHVGIYIGGGRIIDAPYPGLSVHISGLYSMPLAGAGRP